MKAHPRLTDSQQAKAIEMARDGATYYEISTRLHVTVSQISYCVAAWIKDNLHELQQQFRDVIESNLSIGKQSMTLPKVSPMVSRPVLDEYADRYVITKRNRLGCTWYQFTTQRLQVSNPRNYSGTDVVFQQMSYATRRASESAAHAAGLCVKCLKRPHVKRGFKCAQCIAYIRESNARQRCE